ncbi:Holliday junction branch migration protein RuvA [Inediibacterium massiliense]|uniref:Holliday junction branch migration protein RuvA n=1 Tax=Inediibacterium massiliense TaxID=1658111 RepID=UPI0006B4B35A|nr:Holliday junction branch migration protein RuvA [Inediibacterium massiliense]
MLEYIKGDLVGIKEDYIVLDHNDMGYKIFTTSSSIVEFEKIHEKIIIYTQLIVREDDISIFGFSNQDELKIFRLLITVNGIGPKVALGILSSINYKSLVGVIISEDMNTLIKAQGVGKKTAQRIILELKDKVDHNIATFEPNLLQIQTNESCDTNEALDALMILGYTKAEASKAIEAVKDSSKSVEMMIKKALKILGK